MKVLVTGATGNIGSQLVPRLASRNNVDVRAYVRNAEKGATLQEAGAELVAGTFSDSDTLRKAAEGVDTVVLITPMHQDAYDQAEAVMAAAEKAGVQKVVRISALNADENGPTDNTRLHGRTDSMIQDSGLTYVILRPSFFMQNLFMSAPSIGGEGNMYWGMGDGKIGIIDIRDIVDCAEASVLSDAYDNQALTLTGPKSISFHDMAESFSAALNQDVNYVPVPPEAAKQAIIDMGMGEWAGEVFYNYSKAYSEGWGDFVTDGVEKIANHSARSFDDFANEVFAPALSGG
jgi:uncharacterized protein YbjT (DUF2867 family)